MKKNYELSANASDKGKRYDRDRKGRPDGKPRRDDRAPFRRENIEPVAGVVVGRNAVRELLKSERAIDKILVRRGDREGSIVVLVAEAIKKGIPVIETDAAKLDSLSGSENHQGIVAMAAEKEYVSVDDILAIAAERGEKPLIVIADCIEDPYNLGALIRCAECAGAHGIIVPKRHAVGLTPAVTKASAGAIEHMAIAKVSNIATTIEELKEKGLWIFASEAGGSAYYETDFDTPAAIVFGSEGNGVGRLIKERSDFIVSIPMYGKVNSLNVSTAASVILCHAARMQREKK
jgi:23S rRNA (guanosine2251-2'-O)-methyltransferase